MNNKFFYKNEKEKQDILFENKNKYLIKETNNIDGNYLIFSEEPIIKEKSEIELLKEELTLTQEALNELLKNKEV